MNQAIENADEKKYMRLFRKETREEERNSLINTMFQNGASPEYLAEIIKLPLPEIRDMTQKGNGLMDLG